MSKIMRAVRGVTTHPFTKLSIGLMLLFSGLSEAWGSLSDDLASFSMGAHHGLCIFGFLNVLASIPDLFDGVDKGIDYLEERKTKKSSAGEGSLQPQTIPINESHRAA
ncbi:hypothetical protein Pan216_00420 [Planctomycetes bacterium Pan216]|uniref:Uncharacterized protein n=1 Tax=Kolteria novifilia TaxID=2527975 RepID=A0A518AWV0_9BACT|nr:hypothetical protein Pan216_00420 [Planctomycetes bacterium Pan216]